MVPNETVEEMQEKLLFMNYNNEMLRRQVKNLEKEQTLWREETHKMRDDLAYANEEIRRMNRETEQMNDWLERRRKVEEKRANAHVDLKVRYRKLHQLALDWKNLAQRRGGEKREREDDKEDEKSSPKKN